MFWNWLVTCLSPLQVRAPHVSPVARNMAHGRHKACGDDGMEPERGWGDQRTRPSGQWRPQEKPQGPLRPRFMWRLWVVEGGYLPGRHQEPHPAALLCCPRGSRHGATKASTIGQGWNVGTSGWKGAHSARPHWSHRVPSAHVAMVIGGHELLMDVFISHLGPGDKDT